jgi:probable rRNA maturation factor
MPVAHVAAMTAENISFANESGQRLRCARLRASLQRALELHGRSDATVSVLLAGDEQIRELNRTYRGIDESTDVLSFPADEQFPTGDQKPLGDIAISIPYAKRQAAERGVSLEQEMCYLVIHGALHLLGFDDETDEDREKMMLEMNHVAVAAGLPADPEWSSLLHEAPSERPA